MPETPDVEHFRSVLLTLKAENLALSATRDSTAATVTLDQSSVGRLSRMDALQQQAMAVDNRQRAQQAVKSIDAAIARCDDGSFGLCFECDEPIARARLEFDPTVLRCIGCASSHE